MVGQFFPNIITSYGQLMIEGNASDKSKSSFFKIWMSERHQVAKTKIHFKRLHRSSEMHFKKANHYFNIFTRFL